MNKVEEQRPWYRHIWPWVLIAIPLSSVLGGILMIYLAVSGSDQLVKDSYYKDGMSINRQLDRDLRAQDMDLEAALNFDVESGEVFVDLLRAEETALVIELFHPLNSDLDMQSTLVAINKTRQKFQGKFLSPLAGRWYIEVRDIDNEWRMRGRIVLTDNQTILMKPLIQ